LKDDDFKNEGLDQIQEVSIDLFSEKDEDLKYKIINKNQNRLDLQNVKNKFQKTNKNSFSVDLFSEGSSRYLINDNKLNYFHQGVNNFSNIDINLESHVKRNKKIKNVYPHSIDIFSEYNSNKNPNEDNNYFQNANKLNPLRLNNEITLNLENNIDEKSYRHNLVEQITFPEVFIPNELKQTNYYNKKRLFNYINANHLIEDKINDNKNLKSCLFLDKNESIINKNAINLNYKPVKNLRSFLEQEELDTNEKALNNNFKVLKNNFSFYKNKCGNNISINNEKNIEFSSYINNKNHSNIGFLSVQKTTENNNEIYIKTDQNLINQNTYAKENYINNYKIKEYKINHFSIRIKAKNKINLFNQKKLIFIFKKRKLIISNKEDMKIAKECNCLSISITERFKSIRNFMSFKQKAKVSIMLITYCILWFLLAIFIQNIYENYKNNVIKVCLTPLIMTLIVKVFIVSNIWMFFTTFLLFYFGKEYTIRVKSSKLIKILFKIFVPRLALNHYLAINTFHNI